MEEGLLAALEVGAPDDHGLSIPGERRHGAEVEVTAVAVGLHAAGAHPAFRLVGNRRGPL
jgi:hypothetical protein